MGIDCLHWHSNVDVWKFAMNNTDVYDSCVYIFSFRPLLVPVVECFLFRVVMYVKLMQYARKMY